MNKYERTMAVLNHQVPDYFPAFLLGADFRFYEQFTRLQGFTPDQMNQYLKDGILQTPPTNLALAIALDFDCSWITMMGAQMYNHDLKIIQDNFGGLAKVTVGDDGIPHAWFYGPGLTTEDKIKQWWDAGYPHKFPEMTIKSAIKQERTCRNKYDGFLVMIGFPGPFENTSMAIGHGLMAKLCRKNPALLHELIKRNLAIQSDTMTRLARQHPAVIMCGDDYGFNEGLQINVMYWREFFKPALKQYCDIAHSYGCKFVLHSCGNIGEIFKDFVEIGIDGVDSLQPNINDLPALKQHYGDQISFVGTIDDSNLLIYGTPKEVKQDVQKKLQILGKNGGYIPGPTNFILDVQLENLKMMVQSIHAFK